MVGRTGRPFDAGIKPVSTKPALMALNNTPLALVLCLKLGYNHIDSCLAAPASSFPTTQEASPAPEEITIASFSEPAMRSLGKLPGTTHAEDICLESASHIGVEANNCT
jgi:hypothetical protein